MPTRNFRELLEAMPADRRRKIEKRFQKSLEAMPLDQLRKAQEMTQLQLAEILGVNQGEVSRLSTGPTSVSARWPITLKLWVGGWRFGRCSRTGRCGSRSVGSWRGRSAGLVGVGLSRCFTGFAFERRRSGPPQRS